MGQHKNLGHKTNHHQAFFNFALLFFLLGLCAQTSFVFSSDFLDDVYVECSIDCLLEKATNGMQEVSSRAPRGAVGCSLRENLSVFEYSWQIGFMIGCYTISMLILVFKKIQD